MPSPDSFRLTTTLAACCLLALQGCQLEIDVPKGGRVVSTDGAFVCEAGETCVIDVVDLFFDQTFVAEPAHGYSFTGWRTRDQHLCAGERGACSLSTAGFEGNPELESLLESQETFFLVPRFSVDLAACPDDPGLVVSPGPAHTHIH